jgi:cytochrome c oxidase cbb3-type subunit II
MKGLLPLFLGLFGTFAFSWIGLTLIPNWQIGHLDPQSDEEGTDIYPMPKSGMAERGRKVFTANGCFYCHSQQIRADYAADDLDRTRDAAPKSKWAARRSAPRDYLFDRPALLGKMRIGPDLANIGKSAPAVEDESAAASPAPAPAAGASPAASPAGSTSPAAAPSPSPAAAETKPSDVYSAEWHHRHLYAPRAVNLDSNMPAYRFLYEKRRISGEPSASALKLTGHDAPPAGFEIVPSYDAQCLVAYLMSLDQSHPLKEVKGTAAAPATSAAPAPATNAAKPK